MKKTVLPYLLGTFAGLAMVISSIPAVAAPGDLFESDFGTNTIFKFAPGGTKTPFVTGLIGPRGLAFDGSGNLFEGESSGTIFKIAPDGTKTTFATGLGNVFGLAFDTSGNLFVAAISGNVFKLAPDGTQATFATGLNAPRALAFDQAGNLFVGEATIISKFTPDGIKTTFASGINNAGGLAFDNAGNLFEADLSSGNIFKFTPDGTKTTFASGLNSPFGLAFDSAGNLFEIDNGSGTIFIFTPGGTKGTFATGLSGGTYLAFGTIPHALFNISTRAFVGTNDAVLIGGFIIVGNGIVNTKVLVRAAGPSLTGAGVAGALQDPFLRLFDSHGNVFASNDNWRTSQQSEILATGLAPTDDRESAILATLPSGAFTAIVTGVGNTTGIARVDVFSLQ